MCSEILAGRPEGGRRSRGACGGFSLVELVVSFTVLTIGLLAQGALTISHYNQSQFNRELRLALGAAQQQIEILRNHDFRTVFAAFDGSTANDPPSTPGPHFEVPGLSAVEGDPDGLPGRIRFPVGSPPVSASTSDPVLREDLDEPAMGLPCDLDGDGLIDDLPKDTSYIHLPVIVEVRWRGKSGNQVLRLATWLTPREVKP
ncbi:MAG: hypothetical protein JXQ29_01725 [Planctomycetes bacterium]|nr:hypothetical protein [Planctomycetota bacterium]